MHSTQVSTTHYNNLTGLDLVLQDFLDPRRDTFLFLSYKQQYFHLKKNNDCVNTCKRIFKNIYLKNLLEKNKREKIIRHKS